MNTRDLAQRALIVKCIADMTAGSIKARRAELADEMANGDRIGVPSPDDPELKVGMVYRTDPKGSAAVTDRAAFTGWMVSSYPERVHATAGIASADTGEAITVLRRHAPHLVTETPGVMPWAENEVLALTLRAKQACGPGGELDVPGVVYEPPAPGVITVKLSDDGPAVIEKLWQEGRIDLTSGEVLALPAGESS